MNPLFLMSLNACYDSTISRIHTLTYSTRNLTKVG